MSQPIEPQYDAPVCAQLSCDGSLQPALYADGTVLSPAGLVDWKGSHIHGWDRLRCVSCGTESVPFMPELMRAWYSVGAYEQRLVMEKTAAIPC